MRDAGRLDDHLIGRWLVAEYECVRGILVRNTFMEPNFGVLFPRTLDFRVHNSAPNWLIGNNYIVVLTESMQT